MAREPVAQARPATQARTCYMSENLLSRYCLAPLPAQEPASR